LAVLEKEPSVAFHQSGHNSGVLHSGVYYRPDSLKAKLCRSGREEMLTFCADHSIPVQHVGKVIVATAASEIRGLEELHRRGEANGVQGCRMLTATDLGSIEPNASGVAALHVPSAAITDFRLVSEALAQEVLDGGGRLFLNWQVAAIEGGADGHAILGQRGVVHAGVVIGCAGLHSVRLARCAGLTPDVEVIPFRGEYHRLSVGTQPLVHGLIYLVPDPRFPFLGVHLSKRIDGSVEAGPNAVLALALEGYGWRSIARDHIQMLIAFPGFKRMAARYWRTGLFEMRRSLWKPSLVRDVQRLVPDLHSADLVRAGAGVRAQAVDRDGNLVDDFAFARGHRNLHVLNAPSPAATASLAIGRHVVREISPWL